MQILFSLIIFLAVFALWICSFTGLWIFNGIELSVAQESVGALFSGLAFAGLILTIMLQMKDLGNQRFETTFFNMLSLHSQNADNFIFKAKISSMGVYTGRSAFLNVFDEIYAQYNQTLTQSKYADGDIIKKNLSDSLNEFYVTNKWQVEFYFSFLERIIELVHKSNLSKGDKKRYMDIIRSQISLSELVVIFYLSLVNGSNYRKYILEYSWFPEDGYYIDQNHKDFIFDSMFSKSHTTSHPSQSTD